MQAQFAFGRQGLTLQLPEGPRWQTITGRACPPLRDAQAAIASALDNPIGCACLEELARGQRSAAISVCDITRPAPNRLTLPPILERLHRAGIREESVTILIATGLHRQATPAELDTILGAEIARRYRIGNHDAREGDQHRWLGRTSRNTPVWIDERFMAADLHITLGFIEQHLMLGFSGGRKLVAPGVAGDETIRTLHSPRFMREPEAREGSIEDNPLHHELLEIARMAGHHFMLDVTMTGEREITGVFAGSPVEAHAAGVGFLRSHSMQELSEYADGAITSAAGYPLDLTFYQTVKGITAAQHLVRSGGPILLLAECSEGTGTAEFAEKLRSCSGHDSYLREIAEAEVIPDQWQLEKLALAGRQHPLFFYTPGIAREHLGFLGENSYADPDAAVAALLRTLPPEPTIALIPEGPYALAQVRPRVAAVA